MMAGKDCVGQIIKALVTVVTLVALTGGFRVIKATLDDLRRLTRGARNAVGPAQLADGLITLHIIDEILDVDLHGWAPGRNRGMRCRQYTPSSHATTPESNKSVGSNGVTRAIRTGRAGRRPAGGDRLCDARAVHGHGAERPGRAGGKRGDRKGVAVGFGAGHASMAV